MKYVLVSGGVISGIGKGVIGGSIVVLSEKGSESLKLGKASSTGLLLKTIGLKISIHAQHARFMGADAQATSLP